MNYNHLDKVKLFRIAQCGTCGQHFLIDENEMRFTLDIKEFNVDKGYYDTMCPLCKSKVRTFAGEYESLPYVIEKEVK